MKRLLRFSLCALLVSGCFTTSKISNTNLSSIYDPSTNFLNPKIRIIHSNENHSFLHFKFDNKELLYMKDSNDKFEAKFEVTIESYPSYEAKEVLDTISKKYTLNNNPTDDSEIYDFIEFNNAS